MFFSSQMELIKSPTLLISKFCGLRSLCNTFLLWQNANPRNNWYLKEDKNLVRKIAYILNVINTHIYIYINKIKEIIAILYKKDLTTSKSISPFKLSKYFFRSWSQCSKTKVNFLSLCNTSYNLTTFLCFNSFSKQISLSADDGTPCI